MSRICRECNQGRLEIEGLGEYGDTIEVYCPYCGTVYEIELDGFGEGCLEAEEAYIKEQQKKENE